MFDVVAEFASLSRTQGTDPKSSGSLYHQVQRVKTVGFIKHGFQTRHEHSVVLVITSVYMRVCIQLCNLWDTCSKQM